MKDSFIVRINEPEAGLNDLIGGVVDAYYNFKHILNLRIEICTRAYYNITNYVDLPENIYLLKEKELTENYNVLFSANHYSNTGKYTHEQIKKIFNFKKTFLNNTQRYNQSIGVHFRHTMAESRGNQTKEEQFLEFKNNFFNKLYQKNKNYLIISDFNIWKNVFDGYTNIVCKVPDLNINEKDKIIYRADFLEQTLHSLYSLSSCVQIFKTVGNFTELIKLFTNNIEIQNLHAKKLIIY